jgi:hypothetical protein
MDGMTTVLDRLRAANISLEARLRASAAHQSSSDGEYESVLKAGEVVAQFDPVIAGLTMQDDALAPELAFEMERYAANLKKLQRACEQMVTALTARRTQIWQEEQAFRARAAWRSTL